MNHHDAVIKNGSMILKLDSIICNPIKNNLIDPYRFFFSVKKFGPLRNSMVDLVEYSLRFRLNF